MIPNKEDIEFMANEHINEDFDENDPVRDTSDVFHGYMAGGEYVKKEMQEEIDRIKMAMATVLGLDKFLN